MQTDLSSDLTFKFESQSFESIENSLIAVIRVYQKVTKQEIFI